MTYYQLKALLEQPVINIDIDELKIILNNHSIFYDSKMYRHGTNYRTYSISFKLDDISFYIRRNHGNQLRITRY